jgi:hypothetical protein
MVKGHNDHDGAAEKIYRGYPVFYNCAHSGFAMRLKVALLINDFGKLFWQKSAKIIKNDFS